MPPPGSARPSRSSCGGTARACSRSRCASAATPTTPRTPCRRRSSPPTARCRASTAGRGSRPGSTGSRPTSATTSWRGAARRPTPQSLPEAADPRDPFAAQRAERAAHARARRAARAVPRGGAPVRRLRPHARRGGRGRGRARGHDEVAQLPRAGAARRGAARRRRGTDDGQRGLTDVDDSGFENEVPEDELEAVGRSLAALGEPPLPPARGRASRCAPGRRAGRPRRWPQRRARRRPVRLGAALSAAAAVAADRSSSRSAGAAAVRSPPGPPKARPQRSAATAAAADSVAAKVGDAADEGAGAAQAVPAG